MIFASPPADFGTGAAPTPSQLGAREQLARRIGRDCVWMDQRHGTQISIWESGAPELRPADILLVDGRQATARRSPAACVVTADCLPILMWDEKVPLYAAVHAGRVGIERGVIAAAIQAMTARGAENLSAVIGPAICPGCYEVSEQIASGWQAADVRQDRFLDLTQRAVRELSVKVRVRANSAECTAHSRRRAEDGSFEPAWHSYRRTGGGNRNAAAIWIDDAPGRDMPGACAQIDYLLF